MKTRQIICEVMNPLGERITDIDAARNEGVPCICTICRIELDQGCLHTVGETYTVDVSERVTVDPLKFVNYKKNKTGLVKRKSSKITIWHINPLDDLKPHSLGSTVYCACNPRINEDENGVYVIHNSWDGREFYTEPFGINK